MEAAAKSVAQARERFRLLGQETKIRHLAVDSGHDYNAPMREAMYGWLEKWLCGRGDGGPIKEPDFQIEEIAALRCYRDGKSRPKTVVTIPEFAAAEGQKLLAALPKPPDHKERWSADAERMRSALREQILGGFPPHGPLQIETLRGAAGVSFRITTETGIRATGQVVVPDGLSAGTAIIVSPGSTDPRGGGERNDNDRTQEWAAAGFAVLNVSDARLIPKELARTGHVAGVPDHNPAEWGLWVNRPLLGQWTWDVIRWLDFLDVQSAILRAVGNDAWKPARPYVVIGLGAMSIPAMLAGGLDRRVAGVSCEGALVSYVGREARPWAGVPMGLLAPGILEVGDVGQLAALLAPRPFVLRGATEPDGGQASPERIRSAFEFTRRIYNLVGALSV